MAISNAQIIEYETRRLLAEGKLNTTGRTYKVETSDGIVEMPEPEAIHTFAAWKALGFKVKKGEHAITRLSIWKYGNRRTSEESEQDEPTGGYCFRKTAHFFAAHQVEPIADTTAARKSA